ncbi:MAG: hypothetical protein PUF50_02095 [Erysipelotrichaceae bacterium]|nr:hypothetical protein [Erysipelotrichaceae bacterium]
MRVVTFIKKLNNTELGKGNTHDSYILIPADSGIKGSLLEVGMGHPFIDKETGKVYEGIRMTEGREIRIPGLGAYYRDKELSAGDEVVLERRTINAEDKYYISTNKYTNIIVLQKNKDGFLVLNPEKLNLLDGDIYLNNEIIKINFIESKKKRSDSPDTADYYSLTIGGRSVLQNYSNNEVIEIVVEKNKASIVKPCSWKKYIIETEER